MNESTSVITAPTVQLRFVVRHDGDRVKHILQQAWECTQDAGYGDGSRNWWLEWRDVPVEKEE